MEAKAPPPAASGASAGRGGGLAHVPLGPSEEDPRHPPKELCCPITQELLRDPVVAEDGHTYERDAILRWFSNASAVRSPVTNEELPPARRLVPNHTLRKILDQYRGALGAELLAACAALPPPAATAAPTPPAGETDETRVQELVERGADVNAKAPEDGSTALHLLVARSRVALLHVLVGAGADASAADDRGETPAAAARRRRLGEDVVRFLDEAAARARARRAADDEARSRERDEHRRRQAELRRAAEASAASASRARSGGGGGGGESTRSLPLVGGTGFFPSLFGLQFQGSLEPVRVMGPGSAAGLAGGGAASGAGAGAGAGGAGGVFVLGGGAIGGGFGAGLEASSLPASDPRRYALRAAEWIRAAVVGRDLGVVAEDARQVQLLSRVLLGLGSSVLLFLLLL